jgi:hypothetical protein
MYLLRTDRYDLPNSKRPVCQRDEQALRARELPATFVTTSLALGKTEAWVTDRTSHRSSQMIYKRQVPRLLWAKTDLNCQPTD